MTAAPTWTSPTVVVITGLPGTGKSTLADRIGQIVGAPVFSGDWLLGAIAPSRVLDGVESPVTRGIYDRLLKSLFTRQLMLSQSAVVDCVASDGLLREWSGAALALGGRLVTVECFCSDENVHRRRVEGRSRNIPGWHEIDWSHVEFMRLELEPLRVERLAVDAMDPVENNVAKVLAHSGHN